MGTLYENITGLCESFGVKPGKMCNEAGISRGLITDLKMGRKSNITVETAQKIANYFGVSVDRVLGTEEKPAANAGSGYSEEDLKLLEFFKNASERDKEILRAMMGGE